MTKFKYDLTLEDATDIQFTNLAGANTGKVESDGNDLVLSNAVGDVLIGDGSSDVYIGDGTNNVDVLFEQSGNIKAEDGSSGVTLTLGSSDTTLAIESPTINTFDTSGVSTFSGAVNVGVDDTGHDVKFFGATTGASMLWDESEDGLLITHPPNDTGLEIYTVSSAAMNSPQFKVGRSANEWLGIYTEDRTAHVIHRQDETDSDPMNTSFELWGGGSGNDNWVWRHGTNTGGSLATVMTLDKAGQLTLTGEVEATGLDINGNADISGTLDMSGNINLNSGADIILEADNVGGGGASSIQYPDAAGTNRIMLAADSDVVILSNRAANGTVQIRANTATAGGGSNEITVVTVEDDKVTISQDLDVTGNVLPGITTIKILPRDFIADDSGRPAQIDDTGSDRWIESDSTNPLYASVEIPPGFKATHVDIYGSATSAVTVYEADINVRTVTSKGTGNIGTQINITDVTSDDTNYLLIELTQASGEQVNGGKVTIAKA